MTWMIVLRHLLVAPPVLAICARFSEKTGDLLTRSEWLDPSSARDDLDTSVKQNTVRGFVLSIQASGGVQIVTQVFHRPRDVRFSA